jgi:putative NADPH-quinone reductase
MKQVLIINGHPDKQSFNYAVSDAYLKGASKTKTNLGTSSGCTNLFRGIQF